MEIPVLKKSPVTFRSEDHTYWLGDKELKGITSTLIKRAYPDTYKRPVNYTEEQWQDILANAAAKGSNMHETIELYDELGAMSDLPELQSYICIKAENKLTVLATEYIVSDEKDYATAVDKVMMRPDGGIILVDFKRTYNLHIENVTCQQSICKRFFEKQNPHLKVSGIYVLWLRDEKARFEELTPWADEALDLLFEADKIDKPFDIQATYGNLPATFAKVEDEVARIETEVKQMQERSKLLKEGLYKLMEDAGVKSWSGSRVKLTRVLPTEKVTLDTKKLKEEMPEVFEKYCKKSTSAGSLRITLVG